MTRRAEQEYLRRSKSNTWERLKPFAPPGHITTVEGLHLIQDFGACLALLDPSPHHKILDLGAGGGWASDWLQQLGLSVVASDLSLDLLTIAYQRLAGSGRARAVCSDAETLPFRSSSFDRVLCMNAMHHLPQPEKVLAEIARVLSTHGRAVFAEPGTGHSRQPHALRAIEDFGVQEADIDVTKFLDQCMAAGFPFVVIEPFSYVVPGHGLTVQNWIQWRKLASERRPARAARTFWNACLELLGARKDKELFREAFSSQVLRVLGAAMQDHPIVVASKKPLDRFLARSETSRPYMSASIQFVDGPEVANPRELIRLHVDIRNSGRMTWVADPQINGYVRVGVQLLDSHRRLIDRDYSRHPLSNSVASGQSLGVSMLLNAPQEPGVYFMKVDLVSEGVTWFEPVGSSPVVHRLRVRHVAPH